MTYPARPLGDICEVLDSQRKPITKRNRTGGDIPYYGATGVLDYVEGYIFDEKLVLVGEDGAKWGAGDNTAFQVSGKAWVNNHAHVIRPNRQTVDDRWLIYYLNFSDLTQFITGLTVPKLNQGRMREIPIPIPPLDEQKRIVAILDEAFEGIAAATANTEKNLANVQAIFERQLDEIFSNPPGCKRTTLSELLSQQPRNGWSPPARNHSDNGTPVLTLSSVTGFVFRPDKRKHTSAGTRSDAHYWAQNGDLLITRSNTPDLVGHVAIASGISHPTIYPDLIMRMRVDPAIAITEYVYYQLRTSRLRQYFRESAQGANPTMKKINKAVVRTTPVLLPSLDEQRTQAARLSELEVLSRKLQAIHEKKITALAELKQSLLQKAFTGQLTADAVD